MTKTKKTEYTEDEQPCLVAKKRCGHYCAAHVLTAEHPRDLKEAYESAVEFVEQGATLEIRPVSFVQNGGLTFHCGCK